MQYHKNFKDLCKTHIFPMVQNLSLCLTSTTFSNAYSRSGKKLIFKYFRDFITIIKAITFETTSKIVEIKITSLLTSKSMWHSKIFLKIDKIENLTLLKFMLACLYPPSIFCVSSEIVSFQLANSLHANVSLQQRSVVHNGRDFEGRTLNKGLTINSCRKLGHFLHVNEQNMVNRSNQIATFHESLLQILRTECLNVGRKDTMYYY